MGVFFAKKAILEDRVFCPKSDLVAPESEVLISTQYESSACLSIEQLQLGDEDHLICGFANGKILKLVYKIGSTVKASLQDSLQEALNQLHLEQLGLNVKQPVFENAFHSAQVYYVGTTLPKMSKVHHTQQEEAVIAACDKPVVFYQAKELIEMQYLACSSIQSVQSVMGNLVYENEKNELVIGRLNGLQRLQMHRMLFKKQITKSLIIPKQESVVVLLEEPNLAFIDETTQAVNMVALVNRSTFNV